MKQRIRFIVHHAGRLFVILVLASAICSVVIPGLTLKHRRTHKQALSPNVVRQAGRLVPVFEQAVLVFGDLAQARNWPNSKKKCFSDRPPLHMLRTDFGGRMVEETFGQIDEGMFASLVA
jgi:putative toxin-antitoxin system antitoxin component (TIGR02293 family)